MLTYCFYLLFFPPSLFLMSVGLAAFSLFSIAPLIPGGERPSAQTQGLFYSQPTTEQLLPCRIIGLGKKRQQTKQVHHVQLGLTTPLFSNQPGLGVDTHFRNKWRRGSKEILISALDKKKEPCFASVSRVLFPIFLTVSTAPFCCAMPNMWVGAAKVNLFFRCF